METTFYTLQELADKAVNQSTSIQDILNGQLYIDGEGWTSIILTKNLREEIANTLSNLYGGRNNTKENVKYTILNERPQHWGLQRTFLKMRNNKPVIFYVSGQDQVWENAQIRKYLSK